MKPDKHKQKKHNEYKRKHGIQDKASKSTETSLKSDAKNTLAESENSVPKTNSVSNEKVSTESATVSNGPPECNWEYLEGDTNEEDDSGEELGEMLRDTANTCFQYQYQRKSHFDEIGDFANAGQNCLDAVSVDFNDLTQMLLCLPLYRRLDLDKDIFGIEDVKRMEEDAESQASHLQNMRSNPSKPPEEIQLTKEFEDLFHSCHVTHTQNYTAPQNNKSSTVPEEAAPQKANESMSEKSSKNDTQATVRVSTGPEQTEPTAPFPVKDVGLHADKKLAMPNSQLPTRPLKPELKEVRTNKRTLVELEQELDDLLNL